MGIEFKGKNGKVQTFDAVSYLKSSMPGAQVKDYNPETGEITINDGQADRQLDVRGFMAANGMTPTDSKSFNDASTALDSSPVSSWQRFRLGLATSETAEVKQIYDAIAKTGATPELDARVEQNQHRALSILKKEFEDAKVNNGEYVVKKGGVWHKVDAPGLSSGDVAQFAGASGLNILGTMIGGGIGALAGTAAPGPGNVAGAVAGSTAGAAAGEAVENLLSYAIERDQIDVKGASQDILTESLMNLVGEGTFRAGWAVGKKAALSAAETTAGKVVAKAAEAAKTQTINGFKAFSEAAHPKVKDGMAALFAFSNNNLSRSATREMLESPATVQEAMATGVRFQEAPEVVQNEMVKILQTGLEGVEDANQKQFGVMVASLKQAADKQPGTVSLNLNETLQNLEKLLEGASPEKRNFLDPVITKTKELIEKYQTKKSGPIRTLLDASGNVIPLKETPTILEGSRAIEALHNLKLSTTEKLKKLGGFTKNTVDSLTDADTLETAFKMETFLDDKIIAAGKQLKLSDSVTVARDLYGATKDALRPIKSRIFSEKLPIKNVTAAARDELGVDVSNAFRTLDSLPGGKQLSEALRKVRVMQSGVEMSPRLALQRGEARAAAVSGGMAATAWSNPATLPLMVPFASPRAAGFMARNLAGTGGIPQAAVRTVGQAAGLTGKAARGAARMLTNQAAIAGFLNTLSRQQKDMLLKDPEAFGKFVQETSKFNEASMQINEDMVIDAGIKANGGQ